MNDPLDPFGGPTWEFSSASNLADVHQSDKTPFHWTGLPNELKEHVLQFCIDDPQDSSSIRQQVERRKQHTKRGFGASRDLGPLEIVVRLTKWSTLLQVTRQIRTLVLRLCFVGRENQMERCGFVLLMRTYGELERAVRRLDRFYQLVESCCIPLDDQDTFRAQAYRYYPRIYPELKQYATFKHAIKTIHIEMSLKKFMQFFCVGAGSFEQYLDEGALTYSIFEEMPNLSSITIHLPGKPTRGWQDLYWDGPPQIFHNDSPCPRTLHRIIYEQAAQVLAPYANVSLMGLMDEVEEQQFCEALLSARKKLRFSEEDFKELYTDCGGGIQLDELVRPGHWTMDDENKSYWDKKQTKINSRSNLFPPKCKCAQRCDTADFWDTRQAF